MSAAVGSGPVSTVDLVAVQTRLSIDDFESPSAFRERMASLGARAHAATADAEARLFVFPEDIGHFVPLAFAPALVRAQPTVNRAIALLAARHPLRVAAAMTRGRTLDPTEAALRAFAGRVISLIRDTFASIARRHAATVVAGSFLRAASKGVVHSSLTFGPDGRQRAITDKVNLVPGLEDASATGLGLVRGDVHRIPVVDTEWGKLATLICYDGFCQPHTRNERFVCAATDVDRRGAQVVANPSANPWPWDEPWVFATGDDTRLRREQWRAEGLPATIGSLEHVRYGVTAHLAGSILDQRFDGRSEILERVDGGVRVLARAETIDASEIVSARVPALAGGRGAAA